MGLAPSCERKGSGCEEVESPIYRNKIVTGIPSIK